MNRSKFIRKSLYLIAVMGLCALMAVPAQSATYYVREDGGSATECTGLTDAPYSGSGSNQNCALSHPFWAISPVGNNPTKVAGGDTLIIDGTNDAQYMIGYGAPNTKDTGKCSKSYPWDCYMRGVPSGPDPAHPTRVLGKGWDEGCSSPPQLWGNERVKAVFSLYKSDNVEIQCLEITDHSDCQSSGPNPCNKSSYPYGPWGSRGLQAKDSENVLIKNLNIHGMGSKGVYAGRLKDWTVENVRIFANPFVGWDGDIGSGGSSNTGTIFFKDTQIQFNGCGETYPGEEPYNCYSQSQGGYGDGVGLAKTAGDWVFDNVDISHNTSDGLDLLYHQLGGTTTIRRSRFEGNAGNQVKVAGNSTISNSILIGNCGYFKNNSIAVQRNFDHCRGSGNTLSMRLLEGVNISVYNSTLIGNGDSLMSAGGSKCLGNERVESRNNILLGGKDFRQGDKTDLFWANGSDGNGSGPCGLVTFDNDYSVIWNTKHFDDYCAEAENAQCSEPKFMEPIVTFYTGNNFDARIQSTSPAVGNGIVLTGKSSLDYNNNERGDVWDIGAIEYDIASAEFTCADGIEYCSTQEDCTGQGYYWYNDVCNVDPETLPTCADDILYCSSSSECTGQGYYWYDNLCHFLPEPEPTCADSILYCTNSADCMAQGYYWYNNTCNSQPESCVPTWCDLPLIECGQPPLTGGTDSCGNSCTKPSAEWPNCIEPEPTCADGIQYCSTQVDCDGQGHYWYNNVCNSEPEPLPTCSDGIQYCITSSECTSNGHYWYNSTCNADPEPLPTCVDGIQYCLTSSECTSNGYYWYNNTCNNEPEPLPTCSDGIQYCITSSECTSNGHYWYNSTCNADPEPIPTCADGPQYCSSSSDCEGQGYYWYNAICNIDPEPLPTCADSYEYCTSSTDCINQGYYWYNNTCGLNEPTCADGIQYCLNASDCTAQGYYWYNNTCHVSAPTCADGIQYCTKSSDCTSQGYYWYNSTCNVDPESEPTCINDGIQYCLTSSECTSNGFYWYNNTCNVEPEPIPTCADGLQYCASSSDCEGQGYYWYNAICNNDPEPLPTCADGIQYCVTSLECTTNNYYWYDNQCNAVPEPEPTCADDVQYCTKKSDCTRQGYFWYDNACHVQVEVILTCADGIQYCTKKLDCEGQGHYWYNNICNSEPEFLPTCADGIQYCLTSTDCTANGNYWYNSTCNADPEPEPTCADGLQYCTVQSECEGQGYYWYDSSCHVEPQPQPESQPAEGTTTSNTTETEPVTGESTDTLLLVSTTDETADIKLKGKSSDDKKPKSQDKKVKTDDKSTVGSSGGGGSGGSSGGGGEGGGSKGGGGSLGSSGGGSSKDKSSKSSRGGGGIGTISGPVSSSVGSSGGSTPPTTFTITDATETDLEGETYTELQKKLQKELGLETPETGSEAGEEGEAETVDGEEVSGEEEKSLLEEFQNGVQEVWDKIVKWFSGLRG